MASYLKILQCIRKLWLGQGLLAHDLYLTSKCDLDR